MHAEAQSSPVFYLRTVLVLRRVDTAGGVFTPELKVRNLKQKFLCCTSYRYPFWLYVYSLH